MAKIQKNKKKKKKKINLKLIARNRVKGLTISWVDTMPNRDSHTGMSGVTYGHSNPVHRANAKKIISTMFSDIKSISPMHWLVCFTTVFDYGGGLDRHSSELEFFGVIDDIGDILVDSLEQDRRKGSESAYRHVEFKMICAGLTPPPISIECQIASMLTK